jgi:cytidyltransferase-like protein
VIVDVNGFAELRGKVAMVDGGFDPLHAGHIAYFRAARELGAPVLCNVSSDEWIARKHPPLLLQRERVAVIDAIRFIDYTHAAASTTADVLGRLGPRFYVKGADWRDRLPKEELEVCAREGVEIVFLETVIDSSTDVLRRHLERTRTA